MRAALLAACLLVAASPEPAGAAPRSAATTGRQSPASPARSTRPAPLHPAQREVAQRRAAAERLARARRWEEALVEVGAAQRAVEAARREASRTVPPPPPPGYRQESAALESELRRRRREAERGRGTMAEVALYHRQERERIIRKYRLRERTPASRPAAERARWMLLAATLYDDASRYLAGRGEEADAARSRQSALRERLAAYALLGRHAEAAAAAEKLLALQPRSPAPYRAVGEYYEERGQFARAVTAWLGLARILEEAGGRHDGLGSGDAAAVRAGATRQLALCYRQLAYCYSRLGRTAEQQAAAKRAAELEARAARS